MNDDIPPSYLTDRWTTQDHLNFEDFRPALQTIMLEAQTPLTVGVFGPWGSGKTSLMRMLQQEIESLGKPSLRTVWFTAWKYDKEEVLWRAFLLRILRGLYPRENRPAKSNTPLEELPILADEKQTDKQKKLTQRLNQLQEQIYSNVEWTELGKRQYKLGKFLGNSGKASAEIIATLLSAGTYPKIKEMVGGDGSPIEEFKAAAEAISRETLKEQRDQLFHMEQFESAFQEALQLLGKETRLIIFVDDLDRCLPEKAIEILEAIKLFMEVSGSVFVLGMDQRIVQKGIEARYGAYFNQIVNEDSELPIRGDVYLQKMVQIPFYLPALPVADLSQFIKNQDKRLHPITREVFAHGLFPNPRQVKRALNVFKLLKQITLTREASGSLDRHVIAWPLLAKTVMIQTQYPELYQLWRQLPTLIRTLEGAYKSQPLNDDDRVWGRQTAVREEAAAHPEDGSKQSEEKQSERRGGLLDPYLNEQHKYALLSQMLAFEPEKVAEDKRYLHQFADLSRAEMAAYVQLAGAVSLEEVQVPVDLPTDLLTELLSNDQSLVKEAVARINEDEAGPKKEAVQQKLITIMGEKFESAHNRIGAGMALGVLDDPRKEIMTLDEVPFCLVPAGEFWLGDESDEKAEARLNATLDDDYWMAQFPVSNAQYQLFVEAGGYGESAFWQEATAHGYYKNAHFQDRETANDFGHPFNLPNHPVVGISWYEALAFTRWLTQQWQGKLPDDMEVRLPTEWEWEKAARGSVHLLDNVVINSSWTAASYQQIDNPMV